jgi:hypothetical protein
VGQKLELTLLDVALQHVKFCLASFLSALTHFETKSYGGSGVQNPAALQLQLVVQKIGLLRAFQTKATRALSILDFLCL